MLLQDFLESYILERDLKPTTEQQLRCSVSNFEKFLGRTIRLAELLTDQVNEYLRHMQASGRAYDTIRSRRTNLLALLNEAYQRRLFDQDTRRIRRLKPQRPLVEAWTAAEVRRLFDVAQSWIGNRKLRGGIDEGLYWSAYVPAAWDSGLRHGDILPLPLAKIEPRFWINQSKTGLPVLVEFREPTIGHIQRLARSGPRRTCPFAWPYEREAFFSHARKLIDAAGLEGTLKYIRRGCCTEIVTSSQNIADGSRKLGHSSPAITKKHYLPPTWQKFPSTMPPGL